MTTLFAIVGRIALVLIILGLTWWAVMAAWRKWRRF